MNQFYGALEKICIFTIYQNYTLALTSGSTLLLSTHQVYLVALNLDMRNCIFPHSKCN